MKNKMSGNGRVISRLKRRLLCLNRNFDERSSSDIKSNKLNKCSLNEASASFKFMKTELMSSVKKNIESSSSDCRETKMSKGGNSDTNSTGEATQKQPNSNLPENPISQIFQKCSKDKTGCNHDNQAARNHNNQAARNHNRPSITDEVNIIAPIEQFSINSHTAVCDSHEVKLQDTRLVCGGQETVPCKELDCVDEPEPLLCTQDLGLESTQNSSDQPEIQWDCQSSELVREVKQLQGQYGMEEIRKVVSSFSNADVELQKHIIPELKLHLPVKSDSVWTRKRKRQKTTVRSGMRFQQKVNGRESVEEILKWLQNKATEQLPDRKEDCQSSCDANIKLPEEEESCDKYTDADVSKQSCSGEDHWTDEELFTGNSLLIKATQNPETYLSSLHNQAVVFKEQICDQENYVESFTGQQTSDSNISSAGSSSSSFISPSVLKVSSFLDLEPSERDFCSVTLSTATINTSVNNYNNLQRPSSNKGHPGAGAATEFPVSSEDSAEYFRPLDTTVTNQHSKICSKSSNGNINADSVRPLAMTVTNPQSKICSRNINGADNPDCFRTLDTAANNPHSNNCFKSLSVPAQKLHHIFKATHMRHVHKLKTLNSNSLSLNVPQEASCLSERSIHENDLFIESQHSIVDSNMLSNSNTNSILGDVIISKKSPTRAENIDKTGKLLVKDVSCSLIKPVVTGGLYYGPFVYCKAKSSQKDTPMLVKSYSCLPFKHRENDSSSSRMGPHFMHPTEKIHILNLSSMHNHDFNVDMPNDDDFQMLRERDVTLKSQSNSVSTSSGGHLEKTAALETLEALQVCSYKTPSVSPVQDDHWNVDIPDDGFQIPLEVDETFICQSSSIPTSAAVVSSLIHTDVLDLSKEKTSGFKTLGAYQIQSLSVHDRAFEKLPVVDEILDGLASTDATSTSAHPKTAASVKAAMNSLHVQSAMTPSVPVTDDDAMNVSISDDDFHRVLQVETSDKVSTSKSMVFKTLQHSDMFPGVSATCNDFNVDVSDGDFHMLLEDDETFVSILTAKTRLSEETAVKVATLNPLYVQLDTTSSISRIVDDDFDVSISDDDLLFQVGKTLDRKADSMLSVKTGLHKKAAAACSMALQEQSDMIEHFPKNQGKDVDVNFSDDDSQLLLEVDEVSDRQAKILSTSAEISLHEKTAVVETSLKTLQMQSDMVQSVSMAQDEYANIPDDDFEQMMKIDEILCSQNNILSASTSAYLHEKTVADKTLKALQIQSNMIQHVSMTQDAFANIPSDDFEQMLDSQSNSLSTSTPTDHHKKTAKFDTLQTMQIQSVMIQSISTTQDEFVNIPENDYEQMLGVNEVLGNQTTILPASTSPNHNEIIAEDETLETLQIQSDLVHCVSVTQDEFANIPDDDFEQILDSQSNFFSTSTLTDNHEKTAAVETSLETLQRHSEVVYSISTTQDEYSNILDDDFEQMLKADEILCSQTNILSTSIPAYLHEKTIAVETSLKALQIQSNMIQHVSMTQDEFANIPDDDFEQMLGVNEALDNQTTILSVSTSPNHNEIITKDETLATPQMQSDLVQFVSVTQDEFANIPDDDFEQMLGVNEVLGNQTTILSVSTSPKHNEIITEDEMLATPQMQSDLVHFVSMTQDEFANIPDDDFEQMLGVNEVLGNQATILSASTSPNHNEIITEDETLATPQMQSDLVQFVSVTQDEFANIPDDDFEQMLGVNEVLGNQTTILSASTSPNHNEIITEDETLATPQIQSDLVQFVSVTQDEFANIPDDDFEPMLEADGILSSQSNIPCTSAPGDLHEKTAQVGSSEMLQMQSDRIPCVSMTPHEDANFPEDDFEYLLKVNVTLDGLSTQAVVTRQPPSSLYNEIMSKCKIFGPCQINGPCVPNNDYAIKKCLKVGETIHSQDGTIPTSLTAGLGVLLTPKSDHLKASLSETSHKTFQMQPSGNMIISKLTNITGGTNHDAFTSDSKQLSCPNLTEFLPSSSVVNNNPSNVNSPRRFRFKRTTPLQINSLPYVSMQSPFTPHFSDCADVKCSTSKSLSSAQDLLIRVHTSAGSQVRCSLEEIEQKRQAALQKRSLRQSQLKDAIT